MKSEGSDTEEIQPITQSILAVNLTRKSKSKFLYMILVIICLLIFSSSIIFIITSINKTNTGLTDNLRPSPTTEEISILEAIIDFKGEAIGMPKYKVLYPSSWNFTKEEDDYNTIFSFTNTNQSKLVISFFTDIIFPCYENPEVEDKGDKKFVNLAEITEKKQMITADNIKLHYYDSKYVPSYMHEKPEGYIQYRVCSPNQEFGYVTGGGKYGNITIEILQTLNKEQISQELDSIEKLIISFETI